MSIPVHFKYRSYPFSARATRRSRNLSLFTSLPAYLIYAFLWVVLTYGILTKVGIAQEPATTVAFLSLLVLFLVLKLIKHLAIRSINKLAYADLKKLQSIDPERFKHYISTLK